MSLILTEKLVDCKSAKFNLFDSKNCTVYNLWLLIYIILLHSIQELLANLNLEKARSVEAAPTMELTIAHNTIGDLQLAFW
jgi:hypothetical protein